MSKITPLPPIFLDNGFKSGASMWFSLDSNSTWGSPTISAASLPQAVNMPISSGNTFFTKTENTPELDWQTQSAALKKTVAKPKSKIPQQTETLTKKSPADDFVQVPTNQRWGAQPIGFPQVQEPFVVEKKAFQATTNKSQIPVQSQPDNLNTPSANAEEETTSPVSLYKTELCRSFEETGSCRYGLKCQFAHGKSELRPVARHPKYKTEVCKTFHTIGTCPYGKRCRFIHIDQGLNQQQTQTPAASSSHVVSSKPIADFSDVLPQSGFNGWSSSWSTPTPVNVSSPVGKGSFVVPSPANPTVTENLPAMKTSNDDNNQRRTSRLVIFQQICS